MRLAGQCTGLLLVAVVNFIARALGFLSFTLVEKTVAGLKGMADFLLVAITNSFARVLGVGDLFSDDFHDFIQFCLAFIKLAVAGFCRVGLADALFQAIENFIAIVRGFLPGSVPGWAESTSTRPCVASFGLCLAISKTVGAES